MLCIITNFVFKVNLIITYLPRKNLRWSLKALYKRANGIFITITTPLFIHFFFLFGHLCTPQIFFVTNCDTPFVTVVFFLRDVIYPKKNLSLYFPILLACYILTSLGSFHFISLLISIPPSRLEVLFIVSYITRVFVVNI